ncbi:alpha/beta hydrolase [Mameliella sp. AT18]|uniref:alpha/beta fold hydrolase n=1 Tax=Mameliella sp. AT18 TaxID=3028385 RepID=UPI0008410EBE|nr:alpha/beta hydrolase [Mameliella sp. AT18]MDD9732370.1 alpha/beta hydrolase [Mameliella sp. AT18]ODM46648.1 alpha/beta hydrolase [Ruegeria sp. PBVC088]
MTLLGGALALAALGAAALPAWRETRRQRTPDLQISAPGQFAELSQGRTHYQWSGPEDAPVVVCVHGLTTPSFVWRGLIPHLTAAGVQVLSYDLYGRGFSDAPRGRQTGAFFTRQLSDLLEHEGIDTPVTLMGYSMGGAIVTCFAAAHPDRVLRLALVAPAGMGHDLGPIARFTTGVPILGDWLFNMGYPRQLRAGIEAERALPSSVQGIADLQLAQLDRRGFLRSVLSSLRGVLRAPLQEEHRKIAGAGIPVTAVWGREDKVIPLSALATLTQWNRTARQEVIDGAGHGLTYTHTDQLARALNL